MSETTEKAAKNPMDIIDQNAVLFCVDNTDITAKQIMAVLAMLLVEDCTVPFITRYRKDKTGGLDEEQIRLIQEKYDEYIEREKRRAFILEAITKQEMMTPEIEKKIKAATNINQLEDIYAPFKSKRKTKAQIAKEAGLEPFAILMKTSKLPMPELAKEALKFINKDKKVATFEDVLKGACDIIIEEIAHDTELKETLRNDYWAQAMIKSSPRKGYEEIKDWQKYKDYFEYEQKVADLRDPKAAHRFLAIRRAQTEKILKVEIVFDEEYANNMILSKHFADTGVTSYKALVDCASKAYKNYIHSSLDLEIKGELKKLSDESAIDVFGVNLKNLLLQPYLGPKTVLALDPGVVTGCKTVVVDNTGKFVVDTVVYPHPPRNQVRESATILNAMIEQFNVEYIAIGNGTFGRETLQFVEDNVTAVKDGKVKATMISEDGASIYSASAIAKKEFPDKDATVRGAISIGRRFQDPLAELVKIDPKSIGVGQYQHDVNQIRLKKSLDGVVESCVNFVGVDINTASAPLLSFISGIGPTVAGNIVKHRDKNGLFSDRSEILKVSRFTDKVFQQAAGFLRVYNGANPLDATFIHPENYEMLENWAQSKGFTLEQLTTDNAVANQLKSDKDLIAKLGEFTVNDIYKSLTAPSQDPRTEFKTTEFRKDAREIKDIKIGERYPGIVKNITQFGAFVDIGIKENGLVHVSQMADHFVDNALDVLKVGQEVSAVVLDVDMDRKRIALSLKSDGAEEAKTYERPSGGPRQSKPRGGGKPKMPKQNDAPLKNNAFAALAGFKVK
ncbi:MULTISPECIES: Tex family protein [unclassified Halobacteriovorax]|uniref:Tex family protein n=1 Tax=unclassified Halobacteriovorax TaxID=2639665 RepID=UPI00399ABE43